LDLTIDGDGALKGKLQFTRDGYDAYSMREKFIAKGETEYVKEYTADKPWQFEKTEFQDVKSVEKAAKEIHAVQINEHVTTAGDVMYINPFIVPQINDNPFKQDQRVYPIDYGTLKENILLVKLTVPEGYSVEEVPQSKVIALPNGGGRFLFSSAVMGNTINITSNFQINKTLFVQDEYLVLKEFYNQVVAKQSEQIVIKKK
jgi:hypothetical protein